MRTLFVILAFIAMATVLAPAQQTTPQGSPPQGPPATGAPPPGAPGAPAGPPPDGPGAGTQAPDTPSPPVPLPFTSSDCMTGRVLVDMQELKGARYVNTPDDKYYVPLIAIAQALGLSAGQDEKTKWVHIHGKWYTGGLVIYNNGVYGESNEVLRFLRQYKQHKQLYLFFDDTIFAVCVLTEKGLQTYYQVIKGGQPNQGQPNQNPPNQGQPNQNPPNQGQPNQGNQPRYDPPNQNPPNQGQPNQGNQPKYDPPNQNPPNQGQPNQNPPNQGQPNQNPPNQGNQPGNAPGGQNPPQGDPNDPNDPNQQGAGGSRTTPPGYGGSGSNITSKGPPGFNNPSSSSSSSSSGGSSGPPKVKNLPPPKTIPKPPNPDLQESKSKKKKKVDVDISGVEVLHYTAEAHGFPFDLYFVIKIHNKGTVKTEAFKVKVTVTEEVSRTKTAASEPKSFNPYENAGTVGQPQSGAQYSPDGKRIDTKEFGGKFYYKVERLYPGEFMVLHVKSDMHASNDLSTGKNDSFEIMVQGAGGSSGKGIKLKYKVEIVQAYEGEE